MQCVVGLQWKLDHRWSVDHEQSCRCPSRLDEVPWFEKFAPWPRSKNEIGSSKVLKFSCFDGSSDKSSPKDTLWRPLIKVDAEIKRSDAHSKAKKRVLWSDFHAFIALPRGLATISNCLFSWLAHIDFVSPQPHLSPVKKDFSKFKASEELVMCSFLLWIWFVGFVGHGFWDPVIVRPLFGI